jgi:precorrin-2 dehydrogenase/sirohydrochlorin ferrochelatase
MPYYPILVDLKDKKTVVLGGGQVALRKIAALLECGADVNVVSRDLTTELQDLLTKGKIRLLDREFREDYLEGAFLVIASTDDPELNQRVSEIAREKGILVNAVDQPADCTFIVPSVIKRGDLLIAVSTSGKSPAMAKRIRERLSSQFGWEYGGFLLLMGKLRKEILSKGLTPEVNSRVFHELVDSPILDLIKRKDWNGVAEHLERILHIRISPEDVMNYVEAE